MFWIIVAVVLVVVLGAMWRHDRRRRGHVDVNPRTAGLGKGQAQGAMYARPNVRPPSPPSGF